MEMSLWVVYEKPTDFPNEYVARKHTLARGGIPIATSEFRRASTLKELQDFMGGAGHTFMTRNATDDPCIVGIWI